MAEFGCDRQISGVSAIELKKHNVKGFIFKILKFTFVYECFACMYVCMFRAPELLGQELETVVYLHGGAGNQIYVPCRSAKCSLVSHLSSAK